MEEILDQNDSLLTLDAKPLPPAPADVPASAPSPFKLPASFKM